MEANKDIFDIKHYGNKIKNIKTKQNNIIKSNKQKW